jgi:hypothetical protein
MAARQLFGFHAAMISQHRDACSPGHANATQRNLNNDKKRQERAKFSELVAELSEIASGTTNKLRGRDSSALLEICSVR